MKRTAFIPPLLLILLFWALHKTGCFSPLLLPDPGEVAVAFVGLFGEVEFYLAIASTLGRLLFAAAISIVIGLPLGIYIGTHERLRVALEPMLDFFKAMPTAALFPVFMLFFGIGNVTKIFAAAWLATFVMITATSYGAMQAQRAYRRLAEAYGVRKRYYCFHIILPGSLPSIVAGLRNALSINLTTIIVVEMFIGANQGVGHAILNDHLGYEMPHMYALILVVGLLGYLLNKGILRLEKRAMHGKREQTI
jgi:ABC-type nitrate/sulfonate/bicarbonate transport system permease component